MTGFAMVGTAKADHLKEAIIFERFLTAYYLLSVLESSL